MEETNIKDVPFKLEALFFIFLLPICAINDAAILEHGRQVLCAESRKNEKQENVKFNE